MEGDNGYASTTGHGHTLIVQVLIGVNDSAKREREREKDAAIAKMCTFFMHDITAVKRKL